MKAKKEIINELSANLELNNDELEQRIDHVFYENVKSLTLGLGILYLIFVIGQIFIRFLNVRIGITIASIAVSFISLITFYILNRKMISHQKAYKIAFFLILLVYINIFINTYLSQSVFQLANYYFLILGCGIFFLSFRWFFLSIITAFIFTASLMYIMHFSEYYNQIGFGLFTSISISFLINFLRIQSHKKFQRMYLLSIKQKENLEVLFNNLQESKERFQQVASNAQEWIWEINTEGLYTYSSTMVTTILGYKPEELVGKKHFFDLFIDEDREELRKNSFRLFSQKKPFRELENQVNNKNGDVVCLLTSAIPIIDDNNHLLGYRGTDIDISNRKKAEESRLQLIKKLEDTNLELKEFAHVVSHDLKAPLRGISTMANWILKDYEDKFDAEGKEQMNLLIDRVHRMHNLIDGILQYSRVGRIEEEKVNIDLNEILLEVIDAVNPPDHIKINVTSDLPHIHFEKIRISQVFLNLLSNAVNYMDKPKGIINIGYKDDGDLWEFFISDNGPGIDKKYFKKIFKIFQTLEVRDEVESTGIGLTTVKKIIEMNNGKIWLESEIGKGTTFYFSLLKSR
ncbi:MAG: PAS domain S-box protein [Candidatus Cloacimonetes bacterium]|nr:PAS domain S-box protein [Candidatus Cloacimonadota bacterium]